MADFEVRVAAGATLTAWLDPPSPGGAPSRLAPHPGSPHLFWKGKVGQVVRLHAVVGGVDAPLDAALGGRLFTGWLAESACPPTPTFSPPGQSSVQTFVAPIPGHYCVGIERQAGGIVLVHVEAE